MNYGLWGVVLVILIVSIFKDRTKTRQAMKMASKQFLNLLPILSALVLFLGIVRSVIDPAFIHKLIGPESGVLGVIACLTVGSIIFMPGFAAFPMAASFLELGAGYPQVAGFIASLMGVGVATMPIEIKYFGMRLTVLRNLLCLITALVFVAVVWGIGL